MGAADFLVPSYDWVWLGLFEHATSGSSGSGFDLVLEDFGRMFDNQPHLRFYFYFFLGGD